MQRINSLYIPINKEYSFINKKQQQQSNANAGRVAHRVRVENWCGAQRRGEPSQQRTAGCTSSRGFPASRPRKSRAPGGGGLVGRSVTAALRRRSGGNGAAGRRQRQDRQTGELQLCPCNSGKGPSPPCGVAGGLGPFDRLEAASPSVRSPANITRSIRSQQMCELRHEFDGQVAPSFDGCVRGSSHSRQRTNGMHCEMATSRRATASLGVALPPAGCHCKVEGMHASVLLVPCRAIGSRCRWLYRL